MAGVRVVLDPVGLFQVLRSPGGMVARDALRRGRRVQAAAQRRAPVRTGRLRASINVRLVPRRGGVAVQVGTNLDYAIYQHDGTGIYGPRHRPIRPQSAKVLVFNGRGGRVYARSVSGARATKFLENALSAAT